MKFEVQDEFSPDTKINIHAHKLPIIAEGWKDMKLDISLSDGFEEASRVLKERLVKVLK